jgi:hypothetical protein
MIRAEVLLSDGQGTEEEGFGLGVMTLEEIQSAEVIETAGRLGGLRSEFLLANIKRRPVQRFGLLVLALGNIELGQLVQAY